MDSTRVELERFIESWSDTAEQNKMAFLSLKAHLEAKPGVQLSFHPREGVTYSLRAAHRRQDARPLFVMVDVIEDQPRWLSVCFYGELIQDPEQRGDFVPGGLLGEDAICFDLQQYDAEALAYVSARMDEAYASASQG
jgi:hypothetical protein